MIAILQVGRDRWARREYTDGPAVRPYLNPTVFP